MRKNDSLSSIVVGGTSALFKPNFCVGFSGLIFLRWISQLLPPTLELNIVIKYITQSALSNTESNIEIKYGNQNQNPGHWSGNLTLDYHWEQYLNHYCN